MRGEAIERDAALSNADPDGPGSDLADADLLALLSASDDWVFVIRANGELLHASASAKRNLGSAFRASAPFDTLWRDEQRTTLETALATLRRGEASGATVVLETRDEPRSRVELRLSAGTFRGAFAAFGIGRPRGDVTADATFGGVEQQQVLRHHDQKFRALFDNVADGMFFADSSGRFYEVNKAACDQLGYTREELLRMTVREVTGKEGFSLQPLLARFDATGHMTYETTHRRKDGSVIPVELTLARIDHAGSFAIAGIARDLTQQRRIQNELREARDRLQATLQALPDLVFEFDADGVVRDFYGSQPHLLLVPPHEFLGKNLRDVVPPNVASTLLGAIREAVQTGLSVAKQYRMGDERWMELSAARRGDAPSGELPRVVAIARDITQRKQHEEELENKNDELTRFTYTVSHDLKSPLVTIKSFLGYLLADMASGETAKVARDVEYMQKAADRMDTLLDDLLELSRVGRKVNPPERLSLRQLTREACEQLAGRIERCGAEIVMPSADLSLWGDHIRLLEVMQNLLDNAIKFSAAAPPVRVTVETSRRDDEWVVSVRDRGIGIDPRHQHKLFGLFEKLHPNAEGTGIGLALVKRIIDVHGGQIWVESEGEGRGTTVSFSLPNTQPEGGS